MCKYLIILLPIFFLHCKKRKTYTPITTVFSDSMALNDSFVNHRTWYLKDIQDDSIPGISLEKVEEFFKRPDKEVIVAVIDNKFDINHEVLRDFIWKNPKETLNYKDDDGNGYVDDLYGWNFIGNEKGENVISANYEFVRFIRYYKGRFENKKIADIAISDSANFYLYNKAKQKLNKNLINAEERLARSDKLNKIYVESRDSLLSYFPDYDYTLEVLNTIDTVKNKNLIPYVKEISEVIKWKENNEMKMSVNQSYKDRFYKKLNINFNERGLVGDNPYDLTDTVYGNNKTFNLLKYYDHGTRVSSVVTSLFKAIPNRLKILTISIVPSGSPHDKDLALAIRYAVNNGAKVINLSFGKDYSIHKEWVFDAIKYAEINNVLVVKACGNSSNDNDEEFNHYPRDNNNGEQELVDNFLTVGASTYKVNENLKASFSNYGKSQVDIFAPGDDIITAVPFGKYKLDGGTSISSAITSGVAALIFSYYPDLTASQVKHIIMDSGVEYTYPIKTPTNENKNKTTPFNELSKSGKIVNAYNALIMADSIAKLKKNKE